MSIKASIHARIDSAILEALSVNEEENSNTLVSLSFPSLCTAVRQSDTISQLVAALGAKIEGKEIRARLNSLIKSGEVSKVPEQRGLFAASAELLRGTTVTIAASPDRKHLEAAYAAQLSHLAANPPEDYWALWATCRRLGIECKLEDISEWEVA